MSNPAESSLPMDFFSNKDKKDYFLSDDVIESFNFKYVSSSQFKHVIEDVRRERMRKKEEKIWSSYIDEEVSDRSESEGENFDDQKISMSKQLMRESMAEVDQELERLKEGALPVRKKRISKSGSFVERKESRAENGEKLLNGLSQLKENTAGSTNMLLTIPEERNGPAYERSPISKLEYSVRTRKSHSDRTLRPMSEISNRFHRSTNDMEYNYSSEMSERYDSDGDGDNRGVRVHPVAAHKILSIQKKISELLDEITYRLSRIPLPDGDRDLRRRQQRVMEFAIRFSRNYLYDLGRQIVDLQRHLRAISPNARVKPTRRGVTLHVQAIEQKLTSAHQLLLHALNAYCKHIPSSVIKGQPGKLKEILEVVIDLKDICTKIHLTTDYYVCGDVEPPPLGNNTQNRCSAILSKLRLSSDNESQLVSHTTQSTPIRGQRNKKRGRGFDNSKGLPTRLSMYSADPRLFKNFGNKKAASTCTKEKRAFGVARKTSTEQHPSTPQQPNPSPVTCKSSKVIVKRDKTKIRLPQKEDEISTMMSTLSTDSDAGSGVAISGYSEPTVSIHKGPIPDKYSSVITPSKRSKIVDTPIKDEPLIRDMTKRANRVTDQELSSLVPVIADLMTLVKSQDDVAIRPVPPDSMDALMDLLKKYRSSKNSEIPLTEEPNIDVCASVTNNENSRRLTRKSCGTRSPATNMQLICVPSKENLRGTRDFVDVDARFCCGVTDQTRDFSRTTNVTAKDLELRNLRVAESSVESLLKYRDEYQCSSRSNPMYTSNSQNKPWDVVAWIADKLVDELVIDVTKEFQMDNVIRKLYELEFK